MKKYLFLLFIALITCLACNQDQTQQKADTPSVETIETKIEYPENIKKVFDAHGSLETWNTFQSMEYDIVREGGNENQFVHLKDRRERILSNDFKMGYDGTDFWVEADSTYKGNPVFYKNLMFYFYAMPFVLADPGINYNDIDSLEFEGVSYPGVRISYQDSIGVSPKDEYFLYYNPENHQMEWLGYTVTYFNQEKSDKISWIRYNDWQDLQGLKLPASLSWYKTEEGIITEPRNKMEFDQIKLSTAMPADSIFAPTNKATIIE